MPNWKKVITSGSDAVLNSLEVTSAVTASLLKLTGGVGDEGTFSWNPLDDTVDLRLNDTTLQLGQELHYHVINQTGTTINNGEVVYVSGISSDKLSIAPYNASLGVDPELVLGIATETILNTEKGFVTKYGTVRDIDTSAFTVGTVLYASTGSSGYTDIPPLPPDHDIFLGFVTAQSATEGSISMNINHVSDASEIQTNLSGSNLISTNVQAALLELDAVKANISDLSSNIVLYPTTGSSAIAGYLQMVTSKDDIRYNTTPQDVSTGVISGSNQLIAELTTDPNIFVGNPGTINLTTVGNIRKTLGSGTASFYFELYQRLNNGTEVLISTSNNTLEITSTLYTQFDASALLDNGTWLDTDRIVIKYYGTRIPGAANPTYELQFGGDSPVRTLLPVPISVIPSDDASDTLVDTSTFNNILDGNDSNVQAALETLDDHSHTLQDITDTGNITTNRVITGDLTVDTDTIHTNTGNVGINTTSPAGLLHIYQPSGAGNFLFSRTNNITGVNFQLSADSSKIRIQGYGDGLTFLTALAGVGTNATERMRITSTGNVGIGTTSPGTKLDVRNSFNNVLKVTQEDTALSNNTYTFEIDSTPHISNMTTAGAMAVDVNSGRAFTINGFGNVGIGTTTPSQKLHISGSARIEGALYDSNNTPGTSGQVLSSTTTGTDWVSLSEISGVDGTGTANYITKWLDGDSITDSVMFESGSNIGIGTVTPTTPLHVQSTSTSLVSALLDNGVASTGINNYNQLKIRVYNSGVTLAQDVGVGGITDSITGGSRGTALGLFYGNQSTGFTEGMRLSSTGNVGIGTTSPSSTLNISHTDAIPLRIERTTAGQTAIRLTNGSANNVDITNDGSNNFTISNAGSERMRITSTGNVGIGTTTPTTGKVVISQTGGTQLHLVSSDSLLGSTDVLLKMTSSSDFRGRGIKMTYPLSTGDWFAGVPYTGGAYAIGYSATQPEYKANAKLLITATGNVGIGTTSPTTKLDVNGVITATGGDSTNWNTAFGWGNHASAGYGLSTADITAVGLTSTTLTLTRAAGNLTTSVPTFNQNTTGNAATATTATNLNRQVIAGNGLTGGGTLNADRTLTVGQGDGISVTSTTVAVNSTVVRTSGNQTISGIKAFSDDIVVKNAIISNQQNLAVGLSAVIAGISKSTYDAVFFDYVIKKGGNLRAGTVFAVHDGTDVQFTETSTNDLGSTAEVELSVALGATNIELSAQTSTGDWEIKTIIRGI